MAEEKSQEIEPVKKKNYADKSEAGSNTLKIVSRTAIGAAVGVAGGLTLVTVAAATEGVALSGILFAKLLGAAGGAAGLAHGVSSVYQERKGK